MIIRQVTRSDPNLEPSLAILESFSGSILYLFSQPDYLIADPMDESSRALSEALNVVKVQSVQLRRYLDTDQVMDALKSASTLIGELRSSVLAPKHYYELYMAVFDALRYLSVYLYDAHVGGKHHLADLYELVQYCGNIVPRLYLMITVGSVYMSVPDAPIREIMRDLMEMCRGVQHPTRGLFLRHYLSGATRDYLPIGSDDGPAGSLSDSINFVLTNFVEMNKLWVRQQHQGPSRERERRELERKELRILVGTNLVRLSQLDGVTRELYTEQILPSILEQVINCKDMIAQEYLMEVIIQVFPDDFHLHTLGPFLGACAYLHPKVSIKQIVISLINRLAAYATREAENENPEEIRRQEEEAANRLAERVRSVQVSSVQTGSIWKEIAEEQRRPRPQLSPFDEPVQVSGPPETEDSAVEGDEPSSNVWDDRPSELASMPDDGNAWAESAPAESEPAEPEPEPEPESVLESANDADKSTDAQDTAEEAETPKEESKDAEQAAEQTPVSSPRKFRGIPENVQLFEVFWEQIVLLMRARPDLSSQDTTAFMLALLNLSLSCYPDRLEYVDQIFASALEHLATLDTATDPYYSAAASNLHGILLAPVNSYVSALTLLALKHYRELLMTQPYITQRSIAQALVQSILRKGTYIKTPEEVIGILDMCMPLICDRQEAPWPSTPQQAEARLPSTVATAGAAPRAPRAQPEPGSAMLEEQGWLARLVHLLHAENPEVELAMFQTVRRYYMQGGERIRITFPPLITQAVRLARLYRSRTKEDDWESKTTTIFHFVHQLITAMYNHVESSELALRLNLLAAQAADECGLEELSYEFYVQAFTVYEESISESRAQLQAIGLIISTLFRARVFVPDNYDTLITKAALHGAKLLKKPHQSAAVMMASHLWWQTEMPRDKVHPPKHALVRDGKRVLECLQKALRIANSCIDERVTVTILCDALDKYLYYYELGVESITARYINSLVDLITKGLESSNDDEVVRAPHGLVDAQTQPDATRRHFTEQLAYIKSKKEAATQQSQEQNQKEQKQASGPDWTCIDISESLARLGIES
ncbi:retromer complex subunit Vps35 [Malassezia cuniculi]|uniref:Retromer complex subunit Vps35 n=1 Tax=Malassezia cuniculi TaxID=948313 RepID=A0AAF0ESH8_9BASI|nr:retromer complex subunit Vps35 [Malassezia cuniculi]